MGVHEQNVQAIVAYFESGVKSADEPGKLGVEIEHVVVTGHSQPVSYSQDHGVEWMLQQLSADLPQKTYGDDGALIGLAGGNQTITLEPAAQFELSTGPYEYAAELSSDYLYFQQRLNHYMGDWDRRAVTIGYHPTAKVDDLELIPKQRYRFMDEHFARFGHFGRCMMRGSAATQVSIDYYSVDDCLRKLRLASGLAPLFALMCDNTPVFEGEPRTHHMMRTEIWQKCDPARCGIVPGAMSRDFSLEAYAEYVLRTPAIFAFDEAGEAYATEQTFDEVYAERPMTVEDVEHVLSLFFNDVRLKTYLEIRPADSMPMPFVSAYVALIKGLFYCSENLDALDELLEGVSEGDVEQAKNALMESGYDAKVYGRSAAQFADDLLELARKALPAMESALLAPLQQLVVRRKTLAMMAAHE